MSVSMTMNGAVLPVLAMYIVAAEEQVRVKCSVHIPSALLCTLSFVLLRDFGIDFEVIPLIMCLMYYCLSTSL